MHSAVAHLNPSAVVDVGEQRHFGEVSHGAEFERDLDRILLGGVVRPPHPFVACERS